MLGGRCLRPERRGGCWIGGLSGDRGGRRRWFGVGMLKRGFGHRL